MESKHDRDTRLRKFLGWGGPDQSGISPREAAKLLHSGGESRHAEGLASARVLDKIAEDAKKSSAKHTSSDDPWGITLRK